MVFFKILYFLHSFFSNLITPFWVIYFHEIGLNFSQIGLLIIFNYISMLIFEIPTGVLSDVWGRKIVVVSSYFFSGILYILIYFTFSPHLLYFIFFLKGLVGTLNSGSLEAWFAEINKDKIDQSASPWSEIEFWSHGGALVSFLLGMTMVAENIFREIWLIIGSGIMMLSLYIICFGKESGIRFKLKKNVLQNYVKTLSESFLYSMSYKLIRKLLLYNFVFYIGCGIISLLWQPFFLYSINIKKEILGLVSFFMFLTSLFSLRILNFVSKKTIKKNEINMIKYIVLLISALIFCWNILSPVFFIHLIIFLFFNFLYVWITPLFMSLINRHIPDNLRATILSINSWATGLSTIIASYLFKYTEIGKGKFLLLLSGIIILLSYPFLYKIKEEDG